LSAVRDYLLNEFILIFNWTVCTLGRKDRECVMRQADGTKSNTKWYGIRNAKDSLYSSTVFLNRRATARYRALASIIPSRERFFWKLSF